MKARTRPINSSPRRTRLSPLSQALRVTSSQPSRRVSSTSRAVTVSPAPRCSDDSNGASGSNWPWQEMCRKRALGPRWNSAARLLAGPTSASPPSSAAMRLASSSAKRSRCPPSPSKPRARQGVSQTLGAFAQTPRVWQPRDPGTARWPTARRPAPARRAAAESRRRARSTPGRARSAAGRAGRCRAGVCRPAGEPPDRSSRS